MKIRHFLTHKEIRSIIVDVLTHKSLLKNVRLKKPKISQVWITKKGETTRNVTKVFHFRILCRCGMQSRRHMYIKKRHKKSTKK